jgi:hypothetical protein
VIAKQAVPENYSLYVGRRRTDREDQEARRHQELLRGRAGAFRAARRPPSTAQARFLRSLAERAYDAGVFSVVLTPFWDKLHAEHFNLDLARYRVDGSRPQ